MLRITFRKSFYSVEDINWVILLTPFIGLRFFMWFYNVEGYLFDHIGNKKDSTSFQNFKYLSCWILKVMYIPLPYHYCFRKFNFHCGFTTQFYIKGHIT